MNSLISLDARSLEQLETPSAAASVSTDVRFFTIVQKFLQDPNFCDTELFHSLRIDLSFSPAQKATIEKIQAIAGQSLGMVDLLRELVIVDPNARLEILKLCLEQDLEQTLANLHLFNIGCQEDLVRIAKICVEKNAYVTVRYFEKFGITDEIRRIEIAKNAFERNIYAVPYFTKFEITDEAARIEIAKICVERSPRAMVRNFEKFEITDEAVRIELAKKCVEECVYETVENFEKFEITDEAVRIELAKRCVEECVCGTVENFEKFEITDEAVRIELATMCAKKDAVLTMRKLLKFVIIDENDYAEIVIKCVLQQPSSFAELYRESWFFAIFHKLSPDDAAAQLVGYFHDNCSNDGFDWVSPYLSNIQNPYTKLQVTQSLAAALFILRTRCSPEQYRKLNELHLIEYVYELRSPHQYLVLIDELAQLVNCDGFTDLFREVNTVDGVRKFDYFRNLGYAMLAALKIRKDVDIDAFQLLQRNAWFKDAINRRLLLTVLLGLVRSNTLTKKMVKSCLRAINCQENKKDMLQTLRHLSSLLDLNATDRLCELETVPENAAQLRLSLKQLADIEIQNRLALDDIPDAADLFAETFGNSRNPQAIIQYAAKMCGTDDPAIKEALNHFVSSVLMGRFFEQRYLVDDEHPHLHALGSEVVERWKVAISTDLVTLDAQDQTTLFDPFRWLYTKLIVDGHLDLARMPLLRAYLTTRERTSSTSFAESAERPDLSVAFQNLCMDFAEAHTPETQLEILHQMKEKIEGFEVRNCEFSNDIDSQIRDLTASVGTDGFRLIDTDDPYHLLLCGTEVSGSCQRVDGNPNFNCCLLGYLLHGQTRLLAVIDKSNCIKARALLRLLIDAEGRPVLFVERHYGLSSCESAIVQFAKKKAAAMGLALMQNPDPDALEETTQLHSLGGPAPFEYCDGSRRGVCEKGRFTIEAVAIA